MSVVIDGGPWRGPDRREWVARFDNVEKSTRSNVILYRQIREAASMPTTEAGRELLADSERWSFMGAPGPGSMRAHIRAIEAEAADAALRAARELDVAPELMVWFHESEEICEHDYPDQRDWPCQIMTDAFLRAFTAAPRRHQLIELTKGVSFGENSG